MRNFIVIEKTENTPDQLGGYNEIWTTVVSCFAEIKSMGANEQYFAHRGQGNITHKIRIRYPYIEIKNGYRIKMKDCGVLENGLPKIRFFRIKSAYEKDDFKKTYLFINAEEGSFTGSGFKTLINPSS